MRSLVHFSAAREAPPHVREGLRRLDPTCEIVYMGDGRWLVGRVRPTNDRMRIATRMLDHVQRMLAVGTVVTPIVRAKVQLAVLGLQGFAPLGEYRVQGEPTGAIVEDVRRAFWLLAHSTDDALWRELDAPQAEAREASRQDLRDDARARDAWRYMFTRSHAVTRRDETNTPHYRSGFTTIKTIGATV